MSAALQAACGHVAWRLDLERCGLCGVTAEELHRRDRPAVLLPHGAARGSLMVPGRPEVPRWASKPLERLLRLAPPTYWRAVLRELAALGVKP